MARSFKKRVIGGATPSLDASLGLIFRLNILWNDADRKALAGDLDAWNFVLDRIYCNLSYRESLDIVLDEKTGEVKKLELAKIDKVVADFFDKELKRVKAAKLSSIKTRNRAAYHAALQDHYDLLKKKDMWLRKFMHELNLYMKEYEFDPSTSLFGGGLGR